LSSLTLGWTDNSSDETGFTVQIATDKNFTQNFRTVDVVEAGVTSYQFTLLAPNTKYYMRVAAFNGAGASAWAPTISDKTLK
jgi:titin